MKTTVLGTQVSESTLQKLDREIQAEVQREGLLLACQQMPVVYRVVWKHTKWEVIAGFLNGFLGLLFTYSLYKTAFMLAEGVQLTFSVLLA